jgi:hypothetical protein
MTARSNGRIFGPRRGNVRGSGAVLLAGGIAFAGLGGWAGCGPFWPEGPHSLEVEIGLDGELGVGLHKYFVVNVLSASFLGGTNIRLDEDPKVSVRTKKGEAPAVRATVKNRIIDVEGLRPGKATVIVRDADNADLETELEFVVRAVEDEGLLADSELLAKEKSTEQLAVFADGEVHLRQLYTLDAGVPMVETETDVGIHPWEPLGVAASAGEWSFEPDDAEGGWFSSANIPDALASGVLTVGSVGSKARLETAEGPRRDFVAVAASEVETVDVYARSFTEAGGDYQKLKVKAESGGVTTLADVKLDGCQVSYSMVPRTKAGAVIAGWPTDAGWTLKSAGDLPWNYELSLFPAESERKLQGEFRYKAEGTGADEVTLTVFGKTFKAKVIVPDALACKPESTDSSDTDE